MLKLQGKKNPVVKLVLQTSRKKESKYCANEVCTTPKLHLVLPLLMARSNSHITHINNGNVVLIHQRLINKAQQMTKPIFSPGLRQRTRLFETSVPVSSGAAAQCPLPLGLVKAFSHPEAAWV